MKETALVFLITALGAASLLSTNAYAQSGTQAPNLRSAIVAAVAEALGAKPNSQPDYLEELKAARRQADTATLCGAQRRPQFLNEDVGAKVIARALELLKVRQFSSEIAERPSYITDLIVTGATSFELGRLAAASDDYRVSLCSAVETNHQ